jgi:hypothetical protein
MSVLTLPKEFIQCKVVKPSDADIKERTVKIIASDETPLVRYSWERWEPYTLIVSHDPKHVNLTRVDSGVCMFFDGHPGGFFASSERLGKVKLAEIIDKQLILTVKVNRSDKGDQYLRDVEDDVEPGNSIGFVINKLEIIKKATYEMDDEGIKRLKTPMVAKAIDWELHEVSAVDIPANPNAGKFNEKLENLEKYPVELIGDVDMSGNHEKNSEREAMSGQSKPTEVDKTEIEKLKQQLSELKGKNSKATLELNYWRLRSSALDLYAVKNSLTEEEFALDFTSNPQDDIAKIQAMSEEDAHIELKTIDRALARASKRKPSDRLSDSQQALVDNSTIDINDKPDGVVSPKGQQPSEKSMLNGKTTDEFANDLVKDIF